MVWRLKPANKFGAKKTVFKGLVYDSRFEASVAEDLDLLLQAGTIKKIERQVRIPLIVNDMKICTYVADFVVTHLDDSKEVVEAKGLIMPVWKESGKHDPNENPFMPSNPKCFSCFLFLPMLPPKQPLASFYMPSGSKFSHRNHSRSPTHHQ